MPPPYPGAFPPETDWPLLRRGGLFCLIVLVAHPSLLLSARLMTPRPGKPRGRRPSKTSFDVSLSIRLMNDDVVALDAWIATQPAPVSRPEAIRAMVCAALNARRGEELSSLSCR